MSFLQRRTQFEEGLNERPFVDSDASFGADILNTAKAKDQFAAILIRRRRFFGLVKSYYLNVRPPEDDVYKNRIGLFAGKPKFNDSMNERIENWEQCARRELEEETGLTGEDVGAFHPLCDLSGTNSQNETNLGAIFITDIKSDFGGRIRTYLVQENAKIRKEIDGVPRADWARAPIGELYVLTITPFFGLRTFFGRWSKFTPQAAFALISAFDKYDG